MRRMLHGSHPYLHILFKAEGAPAVHCLKIEPSGAAEDGKAVGIIPLRSRSCKF